MSEGQGFLSYFGPAEELSTLQARLERAGFAAGRAQRGAGLLVRIREGTADADDVARIAATAPGVRPGPPSSPANSIRGYREGR